MPRGTEAIVVDKAGDRVKVRIYRSPTCRNCTCILRDACTPEEVERRRGLLGSLFRSSAVLEVEALNPAQADVGDRCLVELKADTAVLKGSLLVYLIPGLLFLLGISLGGWLAQAQWGLSGDPRIGVQVLGGALGLIAGFGFAAFYGRRHAEDEFQPIVARVLVRAEGPRRSGPLPIAPAPAGPRE